ncbi:response regulator [Flavobacteriales bacterium]|nr:response regulator [Flavobacteriales bacterium]
MTTAILCVDDDKLVLNSLRLQLSRYYANQYTLEFAQDAHEGFEVIEELAACDIKTVVIISDWIMPGMNGDEFLLRVRESYPKINTMILTGQAGEKKLSELDNLKGAHRIMEKPWNEAQLINTVNQMLGK